MAPDLYCCGIWGAGVLKESINCMQGSLEASRLYKQRWKVWQGGSKFCLSSSELVALHD